ncbi:EAL domain-containing protein [Chitinasiproducens palmae]|uniref:EAL domain, c-di-GMP-specific phosphodiesterase class I (Or its enzymatically inactive variant) n=1 Tax=Chitinasiproducens palmae TaxID=1770053 RepID=A0A1H2PP46_9BURK|nr:EAL domain-containing protein [Chitinasiproducens palmae]SDV47643.1 EAL domain, c-di-GMP-specific phosphodiesterase class I (or its enzymatically inactive variant) [Chitinasiproducens palmae]
MNVFARDDRPFRPTVDDVDGRRTLHYGELTLFSAFEPVLSVSHMRPAGYEALLRAHDQAGQAVAPLSVFTQAARLGDLLELDRLSQSLHLANFRGLQRDHEWLFLNIHPAALADFRHGTALIEQMRTLDLPPQRVVLQVVEQPNADPRRLVESIHLLRRHGFLIALDHFGAGHSNIDRVWQLQPDIVKLDRGMVFHATQHAHVERVLPGLVSLLHESGRLVLIEGVETEHEALIAIEAGVDFVQGAYLAPVGTAPPSAGQVLQDMDALADRLRDRDAARAQARESVIAPYRAALAEAVTLLRGGATLADACAGLLALPEAARCFLLDERGRQLGANVMPRRPMRQRARRFMPLVDATGARWDRRPYFRSALDSPGRIAQTAPYLSINEAHLCVTLSVAFAPTAHQGLQVLCADIDWSGVDRRDNLPAAINFGAFSAV